MPMNYYVAEGGSHFTVLRLQLLEPLHRDGAFCPTGLVFSEIHLICDMFAAAGCRALCTALRLLAYGHY